MPNFMNFIILHFSGKMRMPHITSFKMVNCFGGCASFYKITYSFVFLMSLHNAQINHLYLMHIYRDFFFLCILWSQETSQKEAPKSLKCAGFMMHTVKVRFL